MKLLNKCNHKEKTLCTDNVDEFIKRVQKRLFVQQQIVDEITNKVSSLDINSIEDKEQRSLVTKRNGMFI